MTSKGEGGGRPNVNDKALAYLIKVFNELGKRIKYTQNSVNVVYGCHLWYEMFLYCNYLKLIFRQNSPIIWNFDFGGILKLRWQTRGREGSTKCQRYYISLFSKFVNEGRRGREVKNPQNPVNVVYGCPLSPKKVLPNISIL